MRDYIGIGPSPPAEKCEQVGPNCDYNKMRRQCQAYIAQLRRHFGIEPTGARLAIKTFQHDFGSYMEVVCYYETDLESSVDYAFRCESEGPQNWDQLAKSEFANA